MSASPLARPACHMENRCCRGHGYTRADEHATRLPVVDIHTAHDVTLPPKTLATFWALWIVFYYSTDGEMATPFFT